MKKILSWLAGLFGGKKPPVIVVPKPPEDKPSKPVKWEWKDKRPIGMVMLANFVTWTATDNWMNGDVPLEQWLTIHAQNCIERMKRINAQGLIVWDPEGQRYPRSYTYYGDPTLAPYQVDIFFRVIREAGFKVGVCIRPDEIVWEPDPPVWYVDVPKHYTVASPADNLKAKMKYARERWGCTLFYEDSNVGVGMGVNVDNTKGYGQVLPASHVVALSEAFPDSLLIPEWADNNYFPYCLPYHHVESNPPGAGGHVINTGGTTWTQQQLNESVRQGNILLGRVWYDSEELPLIQEAYSNQI